MAKKTTKQDQNKISSFAEFVKKERTRFLLGVSSLFLGLFALLGMISFLFTGASDQSKVVNRSFFELITQKQDIDNWAGVAGAYVGQNLINQWFGIGSFVVPIFMIILGLKLMRVMRRISLIRTFLLSIFTLIWSSVTFSFIFSRLFEESHIVWGGAHGQYLDNILQNMLGIPGLIMCILLMTVIFIIITKKTSLEFFHNLFQVPTQKEEEITPQNEEIPIKENSKNIWLKKITSYVFPKDKEDIDNDIQEIDKYTNIQSNNDVNSKNNTLSKDDDFEIVLPKDDEYIHEKVDIETSENKLATNETNDSKLDNNNVDDFLDEMEEYDPTKDLSHFSFPSSSLLKIYDNGNRGIDMEEQNTNKNKIITTLNNYGIEITSIKATVGPTITLYEIVPKAGVRISKIRNLEDDIALSLSALGIRIIAPMPGKGTIGIEVPNKDPQIVSMQSVIASKKFQECNYDLPVALGKTITNEIFMFDLCKMPHLLVAGATGQGKSVGLNAIITSLLYKKHPAEMKMVLVDPKMVEFNIYSTIEKHYLAKLPDAEKAIITDVSKVTQTLNSLTKEMDDRYELLMNAGVRNIKEYNEKFKKRRLNPLKGHRFLPYIVVIIDEFGDLIMTAGKEIEMPIARIAQKARAVGMHMIIATQRPTTNIITGTIKANFPARMAFRVTSQIDSRTILDTSGANQLIGRGDMLFSQGSDLVRIQCAFVDTPEVEGITQYISNQQGYASAFELPEFIGDVSEDKVGAIDLSDRDPLFEEAARLIVVHQQGSTSLIQRKFSIGYNRAGRLMDQIEAAGIVGPAQGSKTRDVLIADEYSLEQKLNSI